MPGDTGESASASLRNFRLYFAASLMAIVSEGVFALTSLVSVSRATGSAQSLGLVIALTTVPSLILTPFQGVLIDRFDKARLATTTCVLRTLLMLLSGVAVSVGSDAIGALFGCILIAYALLYFQLPVFETMLKLLLPEGSAMPRLAATQAAWQAGHLGAMVVAGLLMEWAGLFSAFCAAAAMSALSALIFLRLPRQSARAAAPSEKPGLSAALSRYAAEFKDGWRYVLSQRGLLAMVVAAASIHPTVQALNTLIIPFVSTNLRTGPLAVGILEGACGAGSALSAMLCVWIAKANLSRKGLLLSLFLMAVSVSFFASSASLVMAGAGYLLVGVFLGNMRVLARALVIQLVQGELAGRVMSIVSFLGLALGILVGVLAGVVADRSLTLAYGLVVAFLLLPLVATALFNGGANAQVAPESTGAVNR